MEEPRSRIMSCVAFLYSLLFHFQSKRAINKKIKNTKGERIFIIHCGYILGLVFSLYFFLIIIITIVGIWSVVGILINFIIFKVKGYINFQ